MSVFRIKHKLVIDTWVAPTKPRRFDIDGPNLTIHKTAAWSAKNKRTITRVFDRMVARWTEIKRLEPDRPGLPVADCWEIVEDPA
jgi:hypothetical protein